MSGTLNPGQPNGRTAAVSGRNRVIAAVISQVPDVPEAPVLEDQQQPEDDEDDD
jgi:hypothetical protein